MDQEILTKVNKKEADCCVGKSIKSIEVEERGFVITLHDGSTLTSKHGLFNFQMIYENKKD